MSHQWMHVTHAAMHAKGKGGKLGAIVMIIVGFFFAPMLFGIPILIAGFVKLFSSE